MASQAVVQDACYRGDVGNCISAIVAVSTRFGDTDKIILEFFADSGGPHSLGAQGGVFS
jgi:hypothetical protein